MALPPMGRMRRFVVAEGSMRPTLEPGDGLIGVRSSRVRRGQVRCFEQPGRPGFWLVKRVGGITGRGADARFEACSDNDTADVVDSRRFGPVPVAGSYLVVLRLPARWLVRRRRGDAAGSTRSRARPRRRRPAS